MVSVCGDAVYVGGCLIEGVQHEIEKIEPSTKIANRNPAHIFDLD
jgi:hypothetical protein